MALEFQLKADPGLQQWLQEARKITTGNVELHAAMGQAIRDGGTLGGREIMGVTRHIQTVSGSYHKTARSLGASPTNYFEAAAKGIDLIASEHVAGLIFVNGGPFIARAYSASVILPGDGKQWLTIPAIAEAYGKRAGEFGDRLEFQPRGKNLGILTWRTGSRGVLKASVRKGPARAASATKARRPSTELTQQVPVVYWCVRKIEQPMDPARMPSTQDLLDLAALGVRRTIAAIAQQTAPRLS